MDQQPERSTFDIMCGVFTTTKMAFTAINIFYVIEAMLTICIGFLSGQNLRVTGILVAYGTILILISYFGLVGRDKDRKGMLLFDMVMLSTMLLLQLWITYWCLVVDKDRKQTMVAEIWNTSTEKAIKKMQKQILCCGFNSTTPALEDQNCYVMTQLCCTHTQMGDCSCPPCDKVLLRVIGYSLKVFAIISFFFSIIKFIGVCLIYHYWQYKDPNAKPDWWYEEMMDSRFQEFY